MTFDPNPRAVAGSNIAPDQAPDYGARIAEQMANDYAELASSVDLILEEARALPRPIADEETLGCYAMLIKRFRDTTARVESHHKKEKEPFLRGGQGVDQFFFGLWDRLARRVKTNKPGASDLLQAEVNDYQNRKYFAEQARRAEEARVAREAAHKALIAQQEAARVAEEARLAAERARNPARIEEKTTIATEARAIADAAQAEALIAIEKAQDARVQTLMKPADMVRTRVEGGALVTGKKVPYVAIVDPALLDVLALWPHIREDHKLAALKLWAKSTDHKRPMPGAIIEERLEAPVR